MFYHQNKHPLLNILFVSYEVAPFFKVGGLADVAGSLPKALGKLGVDVRVIMPYYRAVAVKYPAFKRKLSNLKFKFQSKQFTVNLFEDFLPNSQVPIYFIEEKKYLNAVNIFDKNDRDRFVLFSQLVIALLPEFDWQPNIIHCHDWQTAPIVIHRKKIKKYKTVFTIHNIGYTGRTALSTLEKFNFNAHDFHAIEKNNVNLLREAILSADKVTTVSPTYAREILTPAYGYDMTVALKQRKKDLLGILNGLDDDVFTPAADKLITAKYDFASLDRKRINKAALQKISHLPPKADVPLIGLVTRLAGQKGLDLLEEIFPALINLNLQLVILGTGEEQLEKFFTAMNKKYHDKFHAHLTFNSRLANQIYAGSDIFLMPSKYEPCGLGQMIAMRYGTIPIVRVTGGLKDTVIKLQIANYQLQNKLKTQNSKLKTKPKLKIKNIKRATGFVFNNYNSHELLLAVQQAIGIFRHQALWKKLINNAMRQDFSWNKPAREYLALYQKIIKLKKK